MNYWEKIFQGNNGYYMDIDNPSRLIIPRFIKEADSILELGCGGGALASLVNEAQYTGIDYSETAIRLAKERYPMATFDVVDTRNLEEFASDNFDVVVMRHYLENQEDWRKTVTDAFRIANKKVIIVMRRPFVDYQSRILESPDDTWVWDINGDEFNLLARQLSVNVSYAQINGEEVVIIGKHMDDVVFDLDDFYDENNNLPMLLDLKQRFPKLRVTLFCIPSKCSIEFIKDCKEKYGEWMEFAVHGWFHDTEHGTAQESNYWSIEEANKYLQMAEDMGVFCKGFRAPGWGINHETYEVLRDRGYWVADHKDHDQWKDTIILPRYTTGHLWEVHGHIQNVNMNGLDELMTTKCNFGDHTEFHFVSEVVGDNNYLYNYATK